MSCQPRSFRIQIKKIFFFFVQALKLWPYVFLLNNIVVTVIEKGSENNHKVLSLVHVSLWPLGHTLYKLLWQLSYIQFSFPYAMKPYQLIVLNRMIVGFWSTNSMFWDIFENGSEAVMKIVFITSKQTFTSSLSQGRCLLARYCYINTSSSLNLS